LLLAFVVAALGVGVLVYLASKTVAFEQADEPDAMRRFQAERAAFGSALPMLEVDSSGRIVRHASPPSEEANHLEGLHTLVYQVQQRRLIRTDVPELQDELFGADIVSNQPIAVERALYWDSGPQVWAAGTGATAVRLP
jgi:hypothetical protein